MDSRNNDDSLGRMRRLEELIHQIDEFTNPAVRAHIQELVQGLLEFHGEAVARMVERLTASGESGQHLLGDMAGDPAVGAMFLLYGLHPQDVETRVRSALDQIRPTLQEQGGRAELVRLSEGVAHVRLLENESKEESNVLVLKQLVEEAILSVAPEVESIVVESGVPGVSVGNGRMTLPTVGGG